MLLLYYTNLTGTFGLAALLQCSKKYVELKSLTRRFLKKSKRIGEIWENSTEMYRRRWRNSKSREDQKSAGFTDKSAGFTNKSVSFSENRRGDFRANLARNQTIFAENR
jgi:hypothetical protein